MKHFYLIVNREKKGAERGAQLIADYLRSRGCECRWNEHEVDGSEFYRYTNGSLVPHETECVIVLGGDGTIIQAARDLYGRNLPLLGINMGHLGYLTQVSRESEIIPAIDALLYEQYLLESRMMLLGRVRGAGKQGAEDVALNDIVIRRMGMNPMHFSVYVNDQLFNDYFADGLIVATPTGSTAYNMSAGGPIVAPQADLMIFTPICPHTLNSRSVVFPGDTRLSIRIGGRNDEQQVVSFDGAGNVELYPGDRVDIERSASNATLIQLKERPFLENIRNKMKQI